MPLKKRAKAKRLFSISRTEFLPMILLFPIDLYLQYYFINFFFFFCCCCCCCCCTRTINKTQKGKRGQFPIWQLYFQGEDPHKTSARIVAASASEKHASLTLTKISCLNSLFSLCLNPSPTSNCTANLATQLANG